MKYFGIERHLVDATCIDRLIEKQSATYRMPLALADASYGDITTAELALLHIIIAEHVSFRSQLAIKTGNAKDKDIPPISIAFTKKQLRGALGAEGNRIRATLAKLQTRAVEPNVTRIHRGGCRYGMMLMKSVVETKDSFIVSVSDDFCALLLAFPKLFARVNLASVVVMKSITALSIYPIVAYTSVMRAEPLTLDELRVWGNSVWPEQVLPRKRPQSRKPRNTNKSKFWNTTLPAAVEELVGTPGANLMSFEFQDGCVNFCRTLEDIQLVFRTTIVSDMMIGEERFRVTPRQIAQHIHANHPSMVTDGIKASGISDNELREFMREYKAAVYASSSDAEATAQTVLDNLSAEINARFASEPVDPRRVPAPIYEEKRGSRYVRSSDWHSIVLEKEKAYIAELYETGEDDTIVDIGTYVFPAELGSEYRNIRRKALSIVSKEFEDDRDFAQLTHERAQARHFEKISIVDSLLMNYDSSDDEFSAYPGMIA